MREKMKRNLKKGKQQKSKQFRIEKQFLKRKL